jgi:hypothetical protein
MNDGKKLQAACMAACLATAWGGADQASADVTFTGTITPNQTVTNAHIYYGNNVSTAAMRPLGTLPANQTTSFTHTLVAAPDVAAWTTDPNAYVGDRFLPSGYVILGLVGPQAEPSVLVSMPDDGAITGGKTWPQLFEVGFPLDFPEAEVIADLASTPASYSINQSYFLDVRWFPYWSRDITGTDYGQPATLVSFSTAGFAGTSRVELVPEPASLAIVALFIPLALNRRRRRRRRCDDLDE